jgi:hypothetical protein
VRSGTFFDVLGPVLTLWTLQAPVVVQGDSSCPRAADVESRLADLMAKVPDGAAQDRAVLRQDLAGLHIDLFRADGVRIAERKLTASSECADLAAAAAVIIATWEAQFRPSAPSPPTVDFELGMFGSLAGLEWVPGAMLAASWAPEPRVFGIYGALSASMMHSQPVAGGPGTISWTRGAALLGPRYRYKGVSMEIDAHAGGLAGLLHLEASGLATTGSSTVGTLGVGAGVHASPTWNRAAPWVGVDAHFWPTREHVQLMGVPPQEIVPRLELHLAVGIGFGRF